MSKFIFYFIIVIVAFLACQPSMKLVNPKFDSPDWIVGKWKAADKEYYEKWIKVGVNEYSGVEYSMESGTSDITGILRIFKLNKEWFYEAKVKQHNNEPILFKYIPDPQWQLKFENDKNDFPQIISYKISTDSVMTTLIQTLDGSKKEMINYRKVVSQ
ncbi:MAG TPA: hypothetical protein PK006_07625 [Saprospiraceae bacterium]|nr:hypothetical protein [Saprospiraceae bacterium]